MSARTANFPFDLDQTQTSFAPKVPFLLLIYLFSPLFPPKINYSSNYFQPQTDCITSYSFTNGLCNLVSPFEVQAGGPRGFAEGDSGDAENRMQQVFQFERELAQQDQERATRPGMILTTEEKYGAMSKYFEPKKPKVAPLRVSQMGVRVSRNKLWGV
jgi:hypothetical protein